MFNRKPFTPLPEGMPGMTTPQGKILHVADKMGNRGIGKQQGTSRVIYDTLPLDGRSEYNFFEGAGSRSFPYTNLDGNSGKLNVGETMAIQNAQLTFFSVDPVSGDITSFTPLSAFFNFVAGEISFLVGEQQVLKRIALQNFTGEFNKDGQFPNTNVYRFETFVTIQSLLEFVARVRPVQGINIADTFVRLTLEGTGSLFAPKMAQ